MGFHKKFLFNPLWYNALCIEESVTVVSELTYFHQNGFKLRVLDLGSHGFQKL